MNRTLITLFRNEHYVELLRHNLPRAFEVADAEARRVQQRKGNIYETVGQEVGVVRERILIAYLRHVVGDMHVELPTANSAMRDVLISGTPLEIKTATRNGKVKAKWTADTTSAQSDISRFEFTSDLLLVRIWWEAERDSVFYIPAEVLQGLADQRNPLDFLSSAAGTNNRGIDIKPWFIGAAERHENTVRIPIDWQRIGMRLDPMARWMAYWADQRDRDPLYG